MAIQQRKANWFAIIIAVLIVVMVYGGLVLYFKGMSQKRTTVLPELSLEEVINNSVIGFREDYWKESWNAGNIDEIRDVPNELKIQYIPVWQSMFIKKNGITDDYFNRHIEITDTGLSDDRSMFIAMGGAPNKHPNRGHEYFEVLYKIKIDWIELATIDSFAIRNPDSDEYLTEQQIESNQSVPVWYHDPVTDIAAFTPLKYQNLSFKEAVRKLKQVHSKLEPRYLRLDRKNGGIVINGFGTIDYDANNCVEGSYNFKTDSGRSEEHYCWIE